MSQPLCPFCLEPHDFSRSLECDDQKIFEVDEQGKRSRVEVPRQYVTGYNQVPPQWLVTVGFSRHGKTCYLAALTLMLEELNRVWKNTNYTYRPLDTYTDILIKRIRQEAKSGVMPDKTDLSLLPRPMLIYTFNVPQIGSNCLVLYDTPGEFYRTLIGEKDKDKLRSLKKVSNIWFLVSLSDLDSEENVEQMRINNLLNTYLTSMEYMGQDLKGRNLIVVYTKGDRIVNQPGYPLPKEVVDYFRNDPFKDLTNYQTPLPSDQFNLLDYVAKIKDVSKLLEDYTREHVKGGGAFIELAKQYGMNSYFCLVSALGQNPQGKFLDIEASRFRVLDPYFLALYLEQENILAKKNRTIRLVLDGSSTGGDIYQYNLSSIAEELARYGQITTYFLGQSRPASRKDQPPPKALPKVHKSRLIGPVLDQSKRSDDFFVVISGQKIHDLEDYAQSSMKNHILLAAVGEEEYQNWPNQINLRPGDSIDLLYAEVRRMLEEQEIDKEEE